MNQREDVDPVNRLPERAISTIKQIEECARQVFALLTISQKEFVNDKILEKINGIPTACRAYSITPHLGGNYVIIFLHTEKRVFFSIQVPICIDIPIQFSELPKNYSSPFTQNARITATDRDY